MTEKILCIDIETSPIIGYTWGPKWETNIIEFIDHTQIISFSAKWLNGKQITKGLNNYKTYQRGSLNDEKLVTDIWNLLNECDIVIAQNGKSFDLKIINARLLFHKISPPSPYKVIDTRTEARKYLKLPSYSLNDMCDYFGIGRKTEHEGFSLWKKCMRGELTAWKKMLEYNAHDVLLTEKLYLKLRPWMASHPNLGIFNDHTQATCIKCNSKKLQSRGFYVTKTKKYKRCQCMDCGGWMRYVISEKGMPKILITTGI